MESHFHALQLEDVFESEHDAVCEFIEIKRGSRVIMGVYCQRGGLGNVERFDARASDVLAD